MNHFLKFERNRWHQRCSIQTTVQNDQYQWHRRLCGISCSKREYISLKYAFCVFPTPYAAVLVLVPFIRSKVDFIGWADYSLCLAKSWVHVIKLVGARLLHHVKLPDLLVSNLPFQFGTKPKHYIALINVSYLLELVAKISLFLLPLRDC